MKYLWLTLLASCGSMESPDHFIDPRLQPHVNTFMADVQAHGIEKVRLITRQITVVSELSDNADGRCRKHTDKDEWGNKNTYRVIYILEAELEHAEQIMYHELGHCEFGLEHTPGGIMNWQRIMFTQDDYIQAKEDYFQLIKEGLE